MTPIPDELDVRTADGVAHAWVCRGGSSPRPGVIVYPDAFDAGLVTDAPDSPHRLVPGMNHAGAHHREAEDRHWRRLEAFFGETLA